MECGSIQIGFRVQQHEVLHQSTEQEQKQVAPTLFVPFMFLFIVEKRVEKRLFSVCAEYPFSL